jgi:hypothetical protein
MKKTIGSEDDYCKFPAEIAFLTNLLQVLLNLGSWSC